MGVVDGSDSGETDGFTNTDTEVGSEVGEVADLIDGEEIGLGDRESGGTDIRYDESSKVGTAIGNTNQSKRFGSRFRGWRC